MVNNSNLLDVKDLELSFFTDYGEVPAVRGVSFYIKKGESLGIVGESGCGKSVTVSSILRLIPSPPGKIKNGEICFGGKDLTKISEKEMRSVRGNQISMIFQEPMTALNPVISIGKQVAEAIHIHQGLSKDEAFKEAIKLLKLVEIPSAAQRAKEYPHQLSGGMRQRVMIAMALSCKPKLLIADEPTTALDVTIQAQVLDIIRKMRDEFGTSVLFITHDIGVIAEICSRVIVMYSGEIVESGEIKDLFANPLHPYTQGLFASIPKLDHEEKRLHVIKGMVTDPLLPPTGCYFHPRCPKATELCKREAPQLRLVGEEREVACHYVEGCK